MVDAEGGQVGIVSNAEAQAAAEAAGMDLVMMAENDPPVCKIMDYGKHVFESKKQKAAQRKRAKRTQIKEMKFRPGTEEGDYQVKLRNLVRFLENGDKAKVTLRYRGREMAHQEIGMELLKRVEADLVELGSVEQFPKMEGRQLTMVIAPKETELVARECPNVRLSPPRPTHRYVPMRSSKHAKSKNSQRGRQAV